MRTNEKLWKRIKKKWLESDKAGDRNQWTARKAQLAVKEYKEKGGDYTTEKKEDNSLKIWTDEDWGYVLGDKTGRYLPKRVRDRLTLKEKLETNRRKRESDKQNVPYSETIKRKFKTAKLEKLKDHRKKYKVVVRNGRKKTLRFGSSKYEDYTTHNDKKRKENYIKRHKPREDWKDPYTAGFWAKHLLWNKKTIDESKKYITKNFNIEFIE